VGRGFERAEERQGHTWELTVAEDEVNESQCSALYFSTHTLFQRFSGISKGWKRDKLPMNTCWLGLNKGREDRNSLSAAIGGSRPWCYESGGLCR